LHGKETNLNKLNLESNVIIFVCALSKANKAMTNEVFDYDWETK
jgi:hypothetical protein